MPLTAGAGRERSPACQCTFASREFTRNPASIPRRDEGGDHPPDPVAFSGRRGGVDDPLHVPGLDVLAGDLADHRGRVQRAQPALAVRVLA